MLDNKIILALKRKPDGSINKYKAWFVVREFHLGYVEDL